MHLYFAYGSNLDLAQMQRRCPDSCLVDVAMLADHRLDFTRYSQHWQGGVADVLPDAQHQVWGLLYQLSAVDLDLLDRYESYPTGYNRTQLNVRLRATQAMQTAWVYQVVQKRPFMSPHDRYLGIIQAAADQWHFPVHYGRYLHQIAQRSAAALNLPMECRE